MSDEIASPSQIKFTWLIGTLAAFALFVVVGAYSSRMTWDYTDYDQQRAIERKATLAKVQEAENALLYPVDSQGHSTAVWIDQAKGTVRIPIDEAMARVVDQFKDEHPSMGCEIVPPAPAAPKPAPMSTNAAPAKPAAPSPAPAPAPAKPKK